MTGDELFALLCARLGPEAHRHRGIDAPARRDTAIAGGSYRAPAALVDGLRAGDGDAAVSGIVVTPQATLPVLERALALGANLVISRQAFLADSQDRPVARPEPALAAKLRFIADHGLAVLRLQDPRTGPIGQRIAAAPAAAIGLRTPAAGLNLADGLVYQAAPRPVGTWVRQLKAALGTPAVRLVGDAAMAAQGIAFATETSRPNALAPLLGRPDVDLLVAGEAHETETTAYVLDAIALGQRKALLLVGSVALERPAAQALADWLRTEIALPVHYEPGPDLLHAL